MELLSREPKSVGAGRRVTVGVLHSSRLGFMRSFAQIVYSSEFIGLSSWSLVSES